MTEVRNRMKKLFVFALSVLSLTLVLAGVSGNETNTMLLGAVCYAYWADVYVGMEKS